MEAVKSAGAHAASYLQGSTFGEDRPYWWVKESSRFVDQRSPDLRHFPVTCLTSPASPLFVLLAIAVGLVLMSSVIKFIRSLPFSSHSPLHILYTNVSQSGSYRPPGGVEEMQGGGRRVRLEWGAYISV
ncbi:hypothetical protein FHG87_014683 [Trinorchestia longiramus]|nr:hypothetical protein FHG87_014683 [Trinorchestia longiramus]